MADNFVVPSKLAPVISGVAMAETYHKQATTANEDMGAPAPQVLYAFCSALTQLDIGEAAKVSIKTNILDKLQSLAKDRSTDAVAVFILRPCHDPAYYKVVMVSSDLMVRAALARALTNLSDVRHYTAPAPASGQEDEVQKWIEKLESLRD